MYPNQPPTPQPAPAGPVAPRRRKPWRDRVLGAAVGACVVGAAWTTTELVGSLGGPDTFTLRGSMTLADSEGVVSTASGGCRGDGGYSDVTEGATVTVYGGSGQVLAVGHLYDAEQVSAGCRFSITVSDVPDGHRFYRVEVAHRGKVNFPATRAKTGDVSLTLGS